jgi:hypothetical protein
MIEDRALLQHGYSDSLDAENVVEVVGDKGMSLSASLSPIEEGFVVVSALEVWENEVSLGLSSTEAA